MYIIPFSALLVTWTVPLVLQGQSRTTGGKEIVVVFVPDGCPSFFVFLKQIDPDWFVEFFMTLHDVITRIGTTVLPFPS